MITTALQGNANLKKEVTSIVDCVVLFVIITEGNEGSLLIKTIIMII
jgi:hypothetical protein